MNLIFLSYLKWFIELRVQVDDLSHAPDRSNHGAVAELRQISFLVRSCSTDLETLRLSHFDGSLQVIPGRSISRGDWQQLALGRRLVPRIGLGHATQHTTW